MHHADINTSYTQNGQIGKSRIFTNFSPVVKIRKKIASFYEF